MAQVVHKITIPSPSHAKQELEKLIKQGLRVANFYIHQNPQLPNATVSSWLLFVITE